MRTSQLLPQTVNQRPFYEGIQPYLIYKNGYVVQICCTYLNYISILMY
jgi:hypothetical protein